MYQTRYFNKNCVAPWGKDQTGFISSGHGKVGADPYKDTGTVLPPRWKDKQFMCERQPNNAGNGYFGYDVKGEGKKEFITNAAGIPGKPGSNPYGERVLYSKTQPMDQRKNGFGSKDAKKRDEFSNTIRTEQYRESIKRELNMVRTDPEEKAALLAKLAERDAQKTFTEGRNETEFLYDVGVNIHTEFNPKVKKDTFYIPPHKRIGMRDMRMGGHMTASQVIGHGAWHYPYNKPDHGTLSPTKNFHDKSHLSVEGF